MVVTGFPLTGCLRNREKQINAGSNPDIVDNWNDVMRPQCGRRIKDICVTLFKTLAG